MPISTATRMPPAPEFLGVQETFHQCGAYLAGQAEKLGAKLRADEAATFFRHPPARLSLSVIGTSLLAAASVAARFSLVPSLLAVTQHSVEVGAVMGAFPLVGRILELGIGQAGLIGAMLPAGAFLAVTAALLVCRGPVSSTSGWVIAHIALGVALAPLWLPGISLTPAIILLVSATTFLASQMLTSRLLEGRTNWPQTLAAVGATLLAAPIGPQLAAGISVGCVLGAAGMIASLSAVAMGIYFCVQAIDSLTDTRSPLIKAWEVPPLADRRLNLRQEPGGDIYGISARLETMLHAFRAHQREGAPLGLRRLCFVGPNGSGRALCARGIAKFLQVPLVAPRADAILRDKDPAMFVKRIFDQARVQARREQSPVILFFGDFDTIVGRHPDSDGPLSAIYSTFCNEMSLDVSTDEQNLVVIVGSSQTSGLSSSFWVETFGALGPADQKRLLADQVQLAAKNSALRPFLPYTPSEDALERWAASAARQHMTGEKTHTQIERAITDASAKLAEAKGRELAVLTDALDEHLLADAS